MASATSSPLAPSIPRRTNSCSPMVTRTVFTPMRVLWRIWMDADEGSKSAPASSSSGSSARPRVSVMVKTPLAKLAVRPASSKSSSSFKRPARVEPFVATETFTSSGSSSPGSCTRKVAALSNTADAAVMVQTEAMGSAAATKSVESTSVNTSSMASKL